MMRSRGVSGLAAAVLLLVAGCGGQDVGEADGLPNSPAAPQAGEEEPLPAPSEEQARGDAGAGEAETESEPAQDLETFSIEYALGHLPVPTYNLSDGNYTVADMRQVFAWLGPVEDMWWPEDREYEPTLGHWFFAANTVGTKPPPEGERNPVADFVLNMHPEYFDEAGRVAEGPGEPGFNVGIPIDDTKVVVQGPGVGQLYVQMEPEFALPPAAEDVGDGLYLLHPQSVSMFRNAVNPWRLGVKEEEMLLHESAADVRKWLLGETAGTLREDLVLMETASLLDELGLAVAHIYPAPRSTIMQDLRESSDENRAQEMENLRHQMRFRTPCGAAAKGWFDEAGEPREVVAYHFGDPGTAGAALREVESVWSDDPSSYRVRDIRQEGSLVYVVLDDMTELGRLARILDRMTQDGDEHFICWGDPLH